MAKQVSIRSDRAHALAVKLAQRHGKSITALIEDALAELDARDEAAIAERRTRWSAALEQDRKMLEGRNIAFEIEDMYDEDGLPC